MPADLPTLQGRLDGLKLALANGSKQVSYNNQTVTYRDISEIQAAIKDVETDIALLNGGTKVTRTYRFYNCKDL